MVVAEQAARLPIDAIEQCHSQFVGAGQPSPSHVHPGGLVEADALDRDAGIDVDGFDGRVA